MPKPLSAETDAIVLLECDAEQNKLWRRWSKAGARIVWCEPKRAVLNDQEEAMVFGYLVGKPLKRRGRGA